MASVDMVKHEIALAFTVDDAPRVYIERIDVLGNTRTRDYVIRREVRYRRRRPLQPYDDPKPQSVA